MLWGPKVGWCMGGLDARDRLLRDTEPRLC